MVYEFLLQPIITTHYLYDDLLSPNLDPYLAGQSKRRSRLLFSPQIDKSTPRLSQSSSLC
jgi:hypothetical protein